ncbi:hypothetical protein [Thalassoglobus sp.]|uniref:hypothetical protein n=1 Tax=Thalassoglobus sp. TaxID=2795869 RepID=UPI003AA83122
MNHIVKNILAIVVGFLIGSIVNIGLVNLGMALVPLPEGADVSTMDGVRESMKLLTPINFVFPFLAHALGTLAGAYTAARMAASFQMLIALGIGLFFLMGGIMMVVMCGGPIWFIASDLLLAYLPMSFLGAILARKKNPLTPEQHDPS